MTVQGILRDFIAFIIFHWF